MILFYGVNITTGIRVKLKLLTYFLDFKKMNSCIFT